MGVGQLRWQCYRCHQKNIILPWQRGFSGEEKKKSTLSHVLKGEEWVTGRSAYDCGCNSWSPLRDAVGSFKKKLIRIWNSILPEPGQPSAQLSKLIRLTTCKKTKHTVSRWYRTVYIPWFVASYDTHKGKRWLNSKPPKPQFTILNYALFRTISSILNYMHYSELYGLF